MESLNARKKKVIDEPVLTGETISLEGLTVKHVNQCYADWLNDKEVCKDNIWEINDNTVEKISKYVGTADKSDTDAVFAIITLDGNKHVGNVGLSISWENNSGEISILIGEKSAWGKGIGGEAYRLVIGYAFKTLGLHRLYSRITARNKAMIKVAEKAGMLFEGVAKESYCKDGEYLDVVKYGMLNPADKK